MPRAPLALLLAVVAAGCGSHPAADHPLRGTILVAPDGNHIAYIEREGIDVADRDGSNAAIVYTSRGACCSLLRWISTRALVFEDDYRVRTVDVESRRWHQVAGYSDYVLSPDRRWIAGYSFSNGHRPEHISVVSIDGSRCLVPADPRGATWPVRFSGDGTRLIFAEEKKPYRTVSVPVAALRAATTATCRSP